MTNYNSFIFGKNYFVMEGTNKRAIFVHKSVNCTSVHISTHTHTHTHTHNYMCVLTFNTNILSSVSSTSIPRLSLSSNSSRYFLCCVKSVASMRESMSFSTVSLVSGERLCNMRDSAIIPWAEWMWWCSSSECFCEKRKKKVKRATC